MLPQRKKSSGRARRGGHADRLRDNYSVVYLCIVWGVQSSDVAVKLGQCFVVVQIFMKISHSGVRFSCFKPSLSHIVFESILPGIDSRVQ